MRDGVELAADLYLPRPEGRFSTIVIRTPYGKQGLSRVAETFVQHDYAVVVQDVRGKYASGGTFTPFVNETNDGVDTLDWIARAAWSDGRVGMWGSSYLAMSGLLVAWHGHPALKAVFSNSGWDESAGINVSGGAVHIGLAIPWLLFEGGKTQRSLKQFDMDELFFHKPLRDVFKIAGVEMPAWIDERVPRANRRSPTARVNVPVFHIAGWYDFVSPGSLAAWRAMRNASAAPQKLMIGPWIHDQVWGAETRVGELDAGPDARMGVDRILELALAWFDVHIRGVQHSIAPVEVFILGENRWRTFADWPPPNTTTQRLYLAARRTLSARPAASASKDSYVFDPDQPVPTHGGANFHFFPNTGIREQSEIERRSDVVGYTTTPLDRDVVIGGRVRAILHVSTEGRSTDFTAKLAYVTPEGKAFNIVDGIVRTKTVPGRIHEITIDLGEIAMRVPKGHRLRLDVSSSNFPKFDRNPNTGEDPFDAVEFRAVRQTIHHSRRLPSRVEIPIILEEKR